MSTEEALRSRDVATQIVKAVSSRLETPVVELPTLHSEIDPDALNSLFANQDSHVEVTFRYAGLKVIVCPEQEIQLSKVSE